MKSYIYIDVFENVGSRLQGVCCSHLAPLQPVLLGWPCVESASPPPMKKGRTTLRSERAHAKEEKDGGDGGLEGEEGHSFNKTGEIAGSKANVRGAWTPPLATLSHVIRWPFGGRPIAEETRVLQALMGTILAYHYA